MPNENSVLEDIQREVKGFGDNVKALQDSMKRDLEAVRKLAEEAKGAASSPETKAQLDALKTSVTEKDAKLQEAVEASTKAAGRLDELEKKLNRSRLGAGGEGNGAEVKAAREFMRVRLAASGDLKVHTDLSDDKIDLDGVKSYGENYGLYLRRDVGPQGAEAKSMSVGSDPDGGYFVSPVMSPRILSVIIESSPIRQLATVETIGSDAIEYPVDDAEAGAGWVGETESRTETSTPTVGVQRIPVHEMYAEPRATQKLLEDASVNIEEWLGNKIGEKFARLESSAFVTGNGIKKPRGFLTYGNGTARGQIEQVISGHATQITADGLIKLLVSLKEPYAAGAAFLMRRATVGDILVLKDSSGRYLWSPTVVEEGKPSVLLGAPVHHAADMPAVAASALAVAYGNFKVGYTIVDRLGISVLRDPLTAKPFVKFYTRKRVGGDVTNFEALKLQVISA